MAVEMERINTLQDIREHLISKIKHTNKLSTKERETVRELQKKWNENHEMMEELNRDVNEMKSRYEKVQDEHSRADDELHNVKEQYNQLLIMGKQIEADLTEHLRKAELNFKSRISTLSDEKQNLEKEIRGAKATEGDVQASRVRHKENSTKWNALRHELKDLDALKLHHALDSVLQKSDTEKRKLHMIVAHLQHQQHEIDQKEMELIARKNVLREAIGMISPKLLTRISDDEESLKKSTANELRQRVEHMQQRLESVNERVKLLREEAVEGAVSGIHQHHHGSGHSNAMIVRMSSLRAELLRRAKILEAKLDSRLKHH